MSGPSIEYVYDGHVCALHICNAETHPSWPCMIATTLAAENLRSWSYVAQPKASASSSRQPAHLRLANGRGRVHGFLLLRVYEYIRTNQSKRKPGHAPTRSSPHLLLLTVMLIQKPCHRQSPNDRLASQLPTRVHPPDRRPISGGV